MPYIIGRVNLYCVTDSIHTHYILKKVLLKNVLVFTKAFSYHLNKMTNIRGSNKYTYKYFYAATYIP